MSDHSQELYVPSGVYRTIQLPVYGIVIQLDRTGGGSIESELHEGCPSCGQPDCLMDCDESKAEDPPESEDEARQRVEFNRAIDGVEALVLAQACAGIDVEAPAYLETIKTAVEACANNIS